MNKYLETKDKSSCFAIAESYARESKDDEVEVVLEHIIKKFKTVPWAKTILSNLRNKSSVINGCEFTLNHPSLSMFMKYRLAQGMYEMAELKLLKENLASTDRVLELGAGIGFLGCQAKTIFPELKYVGFEANPTLIDLIESNQKKNNLSFDVINGVADNEKGTIDFGIHKDFWASSIGYSENKDCTNVQVKKYDVNEVIKKNDLNFIIMDIEGGELDLIAKIDLMRINKIIIELHPHMIGDDGVSDVISFILKSGLNLCIGSIKGHVFYFQRDKVN